jgi:hypothetical protein
MASLQYIPIRLCIAYSFVVLASFDLTNQSNKKQSAVYRKTQSVGAAQMWRARPAPTTVYVLTLALFPSSNYFLHLTAFVTNRVQARLFSLT